MAKINPANTEYGRAAQELNAIGDRIDTRHWDVLQQAIKLLNQRHMEILAEQADTSRDDGDEL